MTSLRTDVFQAIADPGRRQILHLLSEQRLTINAIAGHFAMSRPAVSKHIKILAQAGFITIQNSGRTRYCALNQEGFQEIQNWLTFYDRFWLTHLHKLDSIMQQREEKK